MKEKEAMLSTSFYANAVLKSDMNVVRQQLKGLVYLRRLTEGSLLKYEVLEEQQNKANGLLEISTNYISLRFFFNKQDPIVYKKNLIIFITFLVFLKELYEFRFEDIYPYVIEALGQNWQNTIKNQEQIVSGLRERIKVINESNSALSYRLIGLSIENRRISSDLLLYKHFSSCIIKAAKEKETDRSNNSYMALAHLNIDFDLIKKVENSLE